MYALYAEVLSGMILGKAGQFEFSYVNFIAVFVM